MLIVYLIGHRADASAPAERFFITRADETLRPRSGHLLRPAGTAAAKVRLWPLADVIGKGTLGQLLTLSGPSFRAPARVAGESSDHHMLILGNYLAQTLGRLEKGRAQPVFRLHKLFR